MYSDLFLYRFPPIHADKGKPTLFNSSVPTSILFIIGIVPAVIILIIAVTLTIIIGLVYREKHRKHKLQYKREVSNNSHKEEEQQIELNHKEKEHQLELSKDIQMHRLNLQHDERIHQKNLDHKHKLECLKTFKEILLKEPNQTIENLKELLIFLNVDIVPLLDLSKRKRAQRFNSNPPVSQCDNNGPRRGETEMGDMIDGVEETDFGQAPSLSGTVAAVALDADEREVMELLGSFIRSAQDSLQQQHFGIPV